MKNKIDQKIKNILKNLRVAHSRSEKYYGKQLIPGQKIIPVDFFDMALAFDEEERLLMELELALSEKFHDHYAHDQVIFFEGEIKRLTHGRHGLTVEPDAIFNEINEADFEGLVIPGGFAPDWLRRSEKVLELIREFNKNNKLIAFICHAGWVPISAGILKGRHVTSIPSIKDDLINAGASWEDSNCVIDVNLVTSRRPSDLPIFMKSSLEVLNKQLH